MNRTFDWPTMQVNISLIQVKALITVNSWTAMLMRWKGRDGIATTPFQVRMQLYEWFHIKPGVRRNTTGPQGSAIAPLQWNFGPSNLTSWVDQLRCYVLDSSEDPTRIPIRKESLDEFRCMIAIVQSPCVSHPSCKGESLQCLQILQMPA